MVRLRGIDKLLQVLENLLTLFNRPIFLEVSTETGGRFNVRVE